MLKVKEHLTTVLEELEWENLNVAQWKQLIFHRNITKNLCPSYECDMLSSVCVLLVLVLVNLCSFSFSSSSKLFACLI